MNYKLRSLMIVAVCLCGSISLRAQSRTTDGRLFVLPPGLTAGNSQITSAATAASTTPVPLAATQPVLINFDKVPDPDQWLKNDCLGVGSGTVLHGILTIDSPNDCYEYILYWPKGIWNQYVANWRGWIVEASLQVDPLTQPECGQRGSVQIWAADPKILLIVGFSSNEICIAYPEEVHFPMDTTDHFHIYRIEAKGMHVKVYVDGALAIDHVLSIPGGGTRALAFGDGTGYGTSRTKWDYLSYDVFP
jgi:hypothetical protein